MDEALVGRFKQLGVVKTKSNYLPVRLLVQSRTVEKPKPKILPDYRSTLKNEPKCMASRTLSEQRPSGHTFLSKFSTFSNGCILLTIGSIYTKRGDFVKLGLHFMTMWINC